MLDEAANRDRQNSTKKHQKGSQKGAQNAPKPVEKLEKRGAKKSEKSEAEKTDKKRKREHPPAVETTILEPTGRDKGRGKPPL